MVIEKIDVSYITHLGTGIAFDYLFIELVSYCVCSLTRAVLFFSSDTCGAQHLRGARDGQDRHAAAGLCGPLGLGGVFGQRGRHARAPIIA